MMTSHYLSRNSDQRNTINADEVEASAFRQLNSPIDDGIYDERIASSFDEFDPVGSPIEAVWQSDDLKLDGLGGKAMEELERRSRILGTAYPFEVNHSKLSYRGKGSGLYEFLLAVSLAENITKGKNVQLPRVFERIVTKLVALSFGEDSLHLHVGSPRDASVGRNFRDAMAKLSEHSGEWIWAPEDDLNSTSAKDEGIDFVVWQKPRDTRRISQLFVLGQCACGNDWDTKFGDLNVKRVEKWFKPATIIDPIKTFAIPFHLVDSKLRESSREAGYIFDRARLVMIDHELNKSKVLTKYEAEMKSLTELVLKK